MYALIFPLIHILIVGLTQATPTTSKSQGTPELATFHDLKDIVPGVGQPNPVGKYKSLEWSSLNIFDPGTVSNLTIGTIIPESGKQFASNSVVSSILVGGISIAADTVKSFDFEEAFIACVLTTGENIVQAAQTCTVSFTGFKKDQPQVSKTVEHRFDPTSVLGLLGSKMSKATFAGDPAFKGLDRVDIAYSSSTLNALTALVLDNVKYTTYAK